MKLSKGKYGRQKERGREFQEEKEPDVGAQRGRTGDAAGMGSEGGVIILRQDWFSEAEEMSVEAERNTRCFQPWAE